MSINTNRWNRIRYSLFAPIYDLIIGFARQRRHSIELLCLQPSERVLIPGAGTGADLPFIPLGAKIHALDITPAMVKRTRRRAAALRRKVDVQVVDAQALDFPDASFDAVILHLIVAVAPDGRSVVEEAARVLKPGGRAVVFDKFAAERRTPSRLRRAINLIISAIATDIARRLGPLIEGTGLDVVRREPAAFGGAYEIVLLRKRSLGEMKKS